MSKDLVIKVGEYKDKEDKTKGEYLKVGVILEGNGGEYALLDPSVNLAGALIKQRVMNAGKENKGKGDMVMCSIFDRDKKNSSRSQHQNDKQNGYQSDSGYDQDIPF